jgi:hypothetical protein
MHGTKQVLWTLVVAAAALGAQQPGSIIVNQQEWRSTPVRHLYIHAVMNGDTDFQLFLPEPSRWKGRVIQFLEGGLGGNERGGSNFGAHLFALDHGAVYVESNQGHRGTAFYEEDDTPAELAYQANYAVMQYAKARCVEIYGRAPGFVYVFGASGGGMRSIQLMERFPETYHGAAPLVAPSDFQLGAFQFSLYEAYREPVTPHRAALDDAVRVGSGQEVLKTLTDAKAQDALEKLLRAGFPKNSLWLVDQSPVSLLVMEYLKYRAAPGYFDEFWTEPGFGGKDGEFDGAIVAGVRGKVTRVQAPRRVSMELAADAPKNLYGLTMRITSGAHAGEWRRVQSNTGNEVQLSMIGPPAAKLAEGDEFELDNRDLIAWKAMHRHVVLPGEKLMRDFLDAGGQPRYRQLTAEQLAVLREPERPLGQIRGKMICVYGADDPLIWNSLGLHYQDLVLAAMGKAAGDHYRLHFLEHAVHGLVTPGAEARQVLNIVAMFRALEEVMAWVETGAAPQPGTTYSADENFQVTFPNSAGARGGYQPVIRLRAGGRAGRVELEPGQELTLSVEAEDPDNDLVKIEVDWEGDGKYEIAQEISGRKVQLEFRHKYLAPGTYFPAVRVTDATVVPGIPFRGIQNVQSLRAVVKGTDNQ